MTDAISKTLEAQPGISRADSWPTGTTNMGPEEYGLTYDGDEIPTQGVLDALEDALITESGPGFHLTPTTDPAEMDYDLIVTAHYHPLSRLLSDFFEQNDSTIDYGLDWTTEDIEACYDDSPNRNLVSPGALDALFEAEDLDYDAVLDALEDHISDWQTETGHNITLEVHSADSDHCHIGLTYAADREQDALTGDVTAALREKDGIRHVNGWICEGDEPSDNAYGITYGDARSRKDVLTLVEELVKKMDDDAEYFPAFVRDITTYYSRDEYDLVVGVTFQLS